MNLPFFPPAFARRFSASPYRSKWEPSGPRESSWSSHKRCTCNWSSFQPCSTLQKDVQKPLGSVVPMSIWRCSSVSTLAASPTDWINAIRCSPRSFSMVCTLAWIWAASGSSAPVNSQSSCSAFQLSPTSVAASVARHDSVVHRSRISARTWLCSFSSCYEFHFLPVSVSCGRLKKFVRRVAAAQVHSSKTGLKQYAGRQVASLPHLTIGGNLPVTG
jgi:hypothetical protein